jgi:hypothetical protein
MSDFIITKTEVKQDWAANKLILPQNQYICEAQVWTNLGKKPRNLTPKAQTLDEPN